MKKLLPAILIGLMPLSVTATDKLPKQGDKCEKTGDMAIGANGTIVMYCPAAGVWRDQSKAASVAIDYQITKDDDLILSGAITTLDGIPAPVGVGKDTTYIAKEELIKTAKGSTITTIPGVIKTGINLTITPTVEENKQIKTNIAIAITELIAINKITSPGGQTKEAPQTKQMSHQQLLILDNDEPTKFTADDYVVMVSAKIM